MLRLRRKIESALDTKHLLPSQNGSRREHRHVIGHCEDNYSRLRNINFLPGLRRFRSFGFSMPQCGLRTWGFLIGDEPDLARWGTRPEPRAGQNLVLAFSGVDAGVLEFALVQAPAGCPGRTLLRSGLTDQTKAPQLWAVARVTFGTAERRFGS